jgi:hypothetical protein
MLKETPGSLRAYFGLIALLAFLQSAGPLAEGKFEGSMLISIFFGSLYAFTAYRMDNLLARRPGFIRGVLIMNLIFGGLAGAISLINGNGLSALLPVALAFAITAYLLSSVSRLSREIAVKPKNTRES